MCAGKTSITELGGVASQRGSHGCARVCRREREVVSGERGRERVIYVIERKSRGYGERDQEGRDTSERGEIVRKKMGTGGGRW